MSFNPFQLKSEISQSASHFSSNLRFLRKRRGLNQDDISALFNKKPNTVGNWENGKTEPSIPELMVISGYFGINLEDLLRSELREPEPDPLNQLSIWPRSDNPEFVCHQPFGSAAGGRTGRLPGGKPVHPGPALNSGNKSGLVEGEAVPGRPADTYNSVSAQTPDRNDHKEVQGYAPESIPASGDILWFLLRELRNMQERLDGLQSAFDQSRPQRQADKSDH